MSQAKTERNRQMLMDYIEGDMTKQAIADKYGIRLPVAWRILQREYVRYQEERAQIENA